MITFNIGSWLLEAPSGDSRTVRVVNQDANPDAPLSFTDWKEVVRLATEILISGRLSNNPFQGQFASALAALLPPELQSPRRWLVKVDGRVTEEHDLAFDALSTQFPQVNMDPEFRMEADGIEFEFIEELAELKIHQYGKNPQWEIRTLVHFCCLVLSHRDTLEAAEPQYSPFLCMVGTKVGTLADASEVIQSIEAILAPSLVSPSAENAPAQPSDPVAVVEFEELLEPTAATPHESTPEPEAEPQVPASDPRFKEWLHRRSQEILSRHGF